MINDCFAVLEDGKLTALDLMNSKNSTSSQDEHHTTFHPFDWSHSVQKIGKKIPLQINLIRLILDFYFSMGSAVCDWIGIRRN